MKDVTHTLNNLLKPSGYSYNGRHLTVKEVVDLCLEAGLATRGLRPTTAIDKVAEIRHNREKVDPEARAFARKTLALYRPLTKK